jgi:hypothetical protein
MARLEEYAYKFKHIQLERRTGILQMRLHRRRDAAVGRRGVLFSIYGPSLGARLVLQTIGEAGRSHISDL